MLRRPIRFSNLVKTSVEGTWEKRVSQMMRAWRQKNKLVSQMGLKFSNVCKKKKRLLIRGAIFSIYLPRIFLLEKKKLSQLVLLCCSSGNFERKFFYLWQSCFIFCFFVGWWYGEDISTSSLS